MPLPSLKDIMPQWWGKREVEPASGASELSVSSHQGEVLPFQTLHRDIDRAFDNFWRAVDIPPLGAGFGLPWVGLHPRTEVTETDKTVEVSFDLPGMNDKDLSVSVANGLLTVRAERKSESETKRTGVHVSERHYGLIHRTVSLPPGTDPDNATAKYHNGVLTISLPKTAIPEQEVKRISVGKG